MIRSTGWALVSIISLGSFSSAVAADMAVKALPPPLPVVVYNWTGCYIGGNVGGGWHKIDQTSDRDISGVPHTPPLEFGGSDGSQFIGGGQVGCDYQFAGRWVVGLQGMFDFGNINSSNNLPDARLPGFFQNTRTRDIYTATARLGYLFVPQVLGYVKGGGAWTNTSTQLFGTIPTTFLSEFASSDRTGWTIGGGVEWMFAPHWSVFAEYNYMDFGRQDIAFTAGPGTIGLPSVNSTHLTMQTALVGVNYKFNWAQPVVAKY